MMHIIKRNLDRYLLLLLPSWFLFTLAWSFLAPDRLYHCYDAPPFEISCFPPFIHPWSNSENLRDYFIWPSWAVYFIWLLFVAGAFSLPALTLWWDER